MSVLVISKDGKPLFPCKERRARCLMSNGRAVAYWQKGIFCIKLTKTESEQREDYPEIVLGVDPGSKREGYTAASRKGVILNVLTDTKSWVKDHVETRRILRRSRRNRKTPYRKCRSNRLRNRKIVPISTRVRWETKLKMIRYLMTLMPITKINIEDVKAKTKPGKKRWNRSFSPLEVGKQWFYNEVRKLGIELIITQGYDTKMLRDNRGFPKTKNKLDWVWEAHNVDSHILAEMALNTEIKPYRGIWKVNFLEYHRRMLHRQNPGKHGVRTAYGSTVSIGMPRGAIIRHKNELYYLGGTSKSMVSIHDIKTGKRVSQSIKKKDIMMMYTNNRRVQFIHGLKSDVSLHGGKI